MPISCSLQLSLNSIMLLLQRCDFPMTQILRTGFHVNPRNSHYLVSQKIPIAPFSFRCSSELACHGVSIGDISGVLHNKVLLSATASAAIGQLSKPFTSAVLYGKRFDWRVAVEAGGFPSTHSSAVVATATSLALERGFSDAIFGLAVVFASLVMYDAQGVRREVGIHAKVFNKLVLLGKLFPSSSVANDTNEMINSYSTDSPADLEKVEPCFSSKEQTCLETKATNKSISNSSSSSNGGLESESISYYSPLKESIGHTQVEVAAGALLGILTSIAICPYA